jgi:hypothetical protein
MKKTTLAFLLLVVISTLLIAGCTQPKATTLPANTPAVVAVQTTVQNQQGVAIMKTIIITATPTPVPTVEQTFEVNINKTTVIVTNNTVPVNKT